MLFFTCAFNSKQENIIFVFIITIIIIILLLLLLLLIITLHLSSSFGTILSVFFLYSVYQKRIRLQMNKVLLGGSGEGDMLVPSLNFKTGCFAFWGGGHHRVCCGSFNQSSCHLLPFLLSFKAMSLAGILPYKALDLNTKAWPDCATIDKSWK